METIVKSMLDGLTQEQQQSILSILFCYIIHHIVIRVSHCVTIFKNASHTYHKCSNKGLNKRK